MHCVTLAPLLALLLACTLPAAAAAGHPADDVDPARILSLWGNFRGPTCPTDDGYANQMASNVKFIAAELLSYGYEVELDTSGGFTNIVASPPAHTAAAPQRFFSVSAHYVPRCDGINEGIIDDGSGAAGMLEMARVLAPLALNGSLQWAPLFLAFEDICGTVFPNASAHFMATHAKALAIVGGIDLDEIGVYDDTPNTSGWPKALSVLFPTAGLREHKNEYRANWIAGFGPKEVNAVSASFARIAQQHVPQLNYYDLTTYMPAKLECASLSPLKNFCLSDSGNWWVNPRGDAIPVLELTDTSPMRTTTSTSDQFAALIVRACVYFIMEAEL